MMRVERHPFSLFAPGLERAGVRWGKHQRMPTSANRRSAAAVVSRQWVESGFSERSYA
jgi:hypothetical protein